ncbi:MAG: MFS transporter [Mariniblastus sp.]
MVRSIAKAYLEAYGGLSKEVWVLSFALFVNRCGSMVLAFLTLYLTTNLNFTINEAGAILSVYGLGSVGGAFLGGKLIKPLGAVRTQIVGFFLSVPLFLLVPQFTTWTGVAISMFFLSLCVESVRPASNVAITQFTPSELHTRAFGLQRMAVNLGFSIGPAVGGFLAEVDYVWLFWVDGISTALGAAVLLWYFGFRKYAKGGDAAKRQKQAEQNQSTGSPLRDLKFILFLLLMLSVAVIFFQFHATYPKYLADEYRFSEPEIGLLFSVNTIIIVIFEMLLVNYVRRFSLLRTIGWGCFLACLGFGILPLAQGYLFAALSMTIITTGEMFMFPLATGFVAKRSSGRDQSSYMSWYAMMYSVSCVIAPLIGAAVYDFDHHLFWYESLGVGCLVLIGFYWLGERVSLPVDRELTSVEPVIEKPEEQLV